MTRTNSPTVRFFIYIALALFTVYNVLPFCWTILNSVKLPKTQIRERRVSSSAPPAITMPISG